MIAKYTLFLRAMSLLAIILTGFTDTPGTNGFIVWGTLFISAEIAELRESR